MKLENFSDKAREAAESGFDAVNDGGEQVLCDKLVGVCETLDMYMERPEESEAVLPESALNEEERVWVSGVDTPADKSKAVSFGARYKCVGCAGVLLDKKVVYD